MKKSLKPQEFLVEPPGPFEDPDVQFEFLASLDRNSDDPALQGAIEETLRNIAMWKTYFAN